MAIADYNDYVTSLSTFLAVPPTDPNFQIALPRIIDDAEQRIYRELDLLDTIVRDTSATLMANSRNFVFPQHIVVLESLNVFAAVGVTITGRRQLTPVSREALDGYWGDEQAPSTPSLPELYAMITDQEVIVGPAPDAAYTMEVVGTIRPAPLTAANTSTYLTLYLPDLFFAESMIVGYSYLKDFAPAADDPQGSVSWASHYKDLWQSANIEETRKRYAGANWSPKQPSQLATPPRS